MAEEFKNPLGSSTGIIEKLKKAKEEKERKEAEEKARIEAEAAERKRQEEERIRKQAEEAERIRREQEEAERIRREEEERQQKIRDENNRVRQEAIQLKNQTEHKKSQTQRIIWSVVVGVFIIFMVYLDLKYNLWVYNKPKYFPQRFGYVFSYCGYALLYGLVPGVIASLITYLMGHLVCAVILENHSDAYDSFAIALDEDIPASIKIENIMDNARKFAFINGVSAFLLLSIGCFFATNYLFYISLMFLSVILVAGSCYLMLWKKANKLNLNIGTALCKKLSWAFSGLIYVYYSFYLFRYFDRVPYVHNVWKFSYIISFTTFLYFFISHVFITFMFVSIDDCFIWSVALRNIGSKIFDCLWIGAVLLGAMLIGIFILSILPMVYLPLKWIVWVLVELAIGFAVILYFSF